MKYCILVLLAAAIVSCNNSGESSQQEDTPRQTERPDTEVPVSAGITGCYMSVSGRDTFVASLEQVGDVVTGRLSFDNFEKDASSGTVAGKKQGDIIMLTYSFNSEGMNSVMDVYFKLENDRLLRAIGDMDTKGDTAYFKEPSAVSYTGSVFEKTPCDQLAEKYK